MKEEKRTTFPGRHDALAEIRAFVAEAAEAAGLGPSAVYKVQLAVDEACSNIIDHAYGGEGRGDIECTCRVTDEGLLIKLRDRGEPFDPDSVPKPELHGDIEERSPGGLGLYFIHNLMDEVDFTFQVDDDTNVLTLVKRAEKPS